MVCVLTPVYNCELYLAVCLGSVRAQSYPHWRCLVIDNCSTDRSLEIAKSFAERDGRFRVITNERFVDVNENHNIACRLVPPEADYVKFVQADDWIYPRCLEEMVKVGEANPRVGIISAFRLESDRATLGGLPYGVQVFDGRSVSRATLCDDISVFGSPTSVLFRGAPVRSRNPHFLDVTRFPHHPDSASCLDVLQEWDFGFVHQVLTFTRRRPGSTMTHLRRLKTLQAENLRMLKAYGPGCMTSDEYSQCLEWRLRQYHLLLTSSYFRRGGHEFRSFHKQVLREAGHPLTISQLCRSSVALALDTSPADCMRWLRRIWLSVLAMRSWRKSQGKS